MEELKKIVKEFIILNGGVIEENEEIKKPLQSEIIEVVFMFKGLTTIIQCNLNDIMKDIINKFMTKADINNHNLIFLYGGELINKNISLKNLIKDLDYKNNKVNVIVDEMEDDDLKNKKNKKQKKKSKYIICPKCQELCLLKINDNYRLKLYECKNGHIKDNILLNDFIDTQYLYESKIKCDNCKKTKMKHIIINFINVAIVKRIYVLFVERIIIIIILLLIMYKRIIYVLNIMKSLYHFVKSAKKTYAYIVSVIVTQEKTKEIKIKFYLIQLCKMKII